MSVSNKFARKLTFIKDVTSIKYSFDEGQERYVILDVNKFNTFRTIAVFVPRELNIQNSE